MKVDGEIGGDPTSAAADVRRVEEAGYDGVWSAETNHDPFLPLAIGAGATKRLELGTGIAVAFARSPMTTAAVANDLQLVSGGRFLLGLGSQIKPHITKRFSMPWSQPAARMREYVQALRAIWAAWHEGERLNFRGDFYTHTLMTPFFDPGPNPHGPPKVFVAAVGERMTEVCGETADGMICHPFTTPRYLAEVSTPAIERGLAKAGRSREKFEVSAPLFVVSGATEEEMAAADAGTRQQIAFYGSTPAYRGVLELHGWADAQDELNLLSKQGRWQEMADVIDDEILHTFAVVAEPDQVGARIGERFHGLVDRVSFYSMRASDTEQWRQVLADIKAA